MTSQVVMKVGVLLFSRHGERPPHVDSASRSLRTVATCRAVVLSTAAPPTHPLSLGAPRSP